MWILFKLIKRPYYDRNGSVVEIDGRQNRYGIDEFEGGGYYYPDCFHDCKESYITDKEVLMNVIKPINSEIECIGTTCIFDKKRKTEQTIKRIKIKLKMEILTDNQADKWLEKNKLGPYNPLRTGE